MDPRHLLVTVRAVWIATARLLVSLDGVRLGHQADGGLVPHAAASAAVLCIVACGPPTAQAEVAPAVPQRRAVRSGRAGGGTRVRGGVRDHEMAGPQM
jgi:hypothetical protein